MGSEHCQGVGPLQAIGTQAVNTLLAYDDSTLLLGVHEHKTYSLVGDEPFQEARKLIVHLLQGDPPGQISEGDKTQVAGSAHNGLCCLADLLVDLIFTSHIHE